MHADFSIELGAQDDAIEVPWTSQDGDLRYYDLKRQPELLLNIQEAFDNQELGEFLAATNSAGSMLESTKCDTWTSSEIQPEEQVYGGRRKFASYVDLIFSDAQKRSALDSHEQLARSACELLKRAPEMASAAEFMIRHCYYAGQQEFGITFYLSGYGNDEREARRRWNIGLKVVENALLQLSAANRRQARQEIR